jgi:cell division protein ZapA
VKMVPVSEGPSGQGRGGIRGQTQLGLSDRTVERGDVMVTVLGETYRLRAEGGLEHLKQVASMVEARVEEVTREYPQASPTRAVVLAALNVADELCRERTTRLEEQDRLRVSTRSMIQAIETELGIPQGEDGGP